MSFAGLTQSDTKFLSDLQKKKDIEKENRRSGDVKAAEPCDVEKITIISSKNPDDSVNLTGGMIRFMYYESLLSNSIIFCVNNNERYLIYNLMNACFCKLLNACFRFVSHNERLLFVH